MAFVMAGWEGSRLHPLTGERSKPAVPFGARYQLVGFVLSNLSNSGIHSVYLLVQYKSQSLIEHVRQTWVLSPIPPEQFVTIVPPQMRGRRQWFQGTADAVRQNMNLIEQHDPELVAVFGADHIYRMNVRQMIRFHREGEEREGVGNDKEHDARDRQGEGAVQTVGSASVQGAAATGATHAADRRNGRVALYQPTLVTLRERVRGHRKGARLHLEQVAGRSSSPRLDASS